MSKNTIAVYRDTFVLLLTFMEKVKNEKVEKLTLGKIDREIINEFLQSLKKERNCSDSTLNTRLAAIHSFYKYLQLESVENLFESQKILSIRYKQTAQKMPAYLTVEGIKLLLQQPDLTTRKGRRDFTLLSLMYTCAARVQEVIDLTPGKIRFDKPFVINIFGKGKKNRIVPLEKDQVINLKSYLKEALLDQFIPEDSRPLFQNVRGEKFTRAGIKYILAKYVKKAHRLSPTIIPLNTTCHSLRHSRAMHLLQIGVNLIYIRDILGHSSVKTTEIYARADSKHKREALEKSYVNLNPNEKPLWKQNENLISWLKKF